MHWICNIKKGILNWQTQLLLIIKTFVTWINEKLIFFKALKHLSFSISFCIWKNFSKNILLYLIIFFFLSFKLIIVNNKIGKQSFLSIINLNFLKCLLSKNFDHQLIVKKGSLNLSIDQKNKQKKIMYMCLYLPSQVVLI